MTLQPDEQQLEVKQERDKDGDVDGVKLVLGRPSTRVSDLPSMCQWLEPFQATKSLNLRFNLSIKVVCAVQMGKSRWGEGCLPALPSTVASGEGCWSWVCKAIIACGLRHPRAQGF